MPYIGTSPSNGVRRVHTYTATASQTTFSGASSEGITLSYVDANYLDVFQNGVLLGSADYTSTSGTSVVLAQGASADDLIVIVVYDVFSVADTVSKTNGGSFDSGVTMSSTLDVTGALSAKGGAVFNEDSVDVDFRIESNGNANMLFVDGGNDRIGIGTSSPSEQVNLVGSSGTSKIRFDGDSSNLQNNFIGITGYDDLIIASDEANSGSASTVQFRVDGSERMRIDNDGKLLIGTTGSMNLGFGTQQLSVLTTGGTSPQILGATNASTSSSIIYNGSSSTAVSMCDWRVERTNSTSYNFLIMRSDNNNDNEFIFRGNGDAFCDGAFSGGGADYAEYFEWADGNTDDEDRRGFTVVLDGNKIRKSTSEDNASSVIGVVSANPTMIGDSGQLRWQGKYERDEWGSYILEEYTHTQWTNADGESKSYQTDKIPSDVTVPSDAVVTSTELDGKTKLMRRKQNSSYDASQTYIPREDRKEWDTVGLMGKLRVRVGQTIGDRWIKMREISDTVHEYLVR